MKTVGIDVSKSTLDICYLNNQTTQITLEATSGYEKPLYLALKTAQLPVVKANPRQVRDFAKACGILAKTDKLDAKVRAHYAQVIQPKH
jgi:transposase